MLPCFFVCLVTFCCVFFIWKQQPLALYKAGPSPVSPAGSYGSVPEFSWGSSSPWVCRGTPQLERFDGFFFSIRSAAGSLALQPAADPALFSATPKHPREAGPHQRSESGEAETRPSGSFPLKKVIHQLDTFCPRRAVLWWEQAVLAAICGGRRRGAALSRQALLLVLCSSGVPVPHQQPSQPREEPASQAAPWKSRMFDMRPAFSFPPKGESLQVGLFSPIVSCGGRGLARG